MLLSEVGAATSVLLGFAPPDTLSAAGSSKVTGTMFCLSLFIPAVLDLPSLSLMEVKF